MATAIVQVTDFCLNSLGGYSIKKICWEDFILAPKCFLQVAVQEIWPLKNPSCFHSLTIAITQWCIQYHTLRAKYLYRLFPIHIKFSIAVSMGSHFLQPFVYELTLINNTTVTPIHALIWGYFEFIFYSITNNF